ncbi:hypothetical protein COU36_02950, partial [Candidatus Micrarchaeota archaeon CG10_big_fil_rev_8_21_14_0_10_59_7]
MNRNIIAVFLILWIICWSAVIGIVLINSPNRSISGGVAAGDVSICVYKTNTSECISSPTPSAAPSGIPFAPGGGYAATPSATASPTAAASPAPTVSASPTPPVLPSPSPFPSPSPAPAGLSISIDAPSEVDRCASFDAVVTVTNAGADIPGASLSLLGEARPLGTLRAGSQVQQSFRVKAYGQGGDFMEIAASLAAAGFEKGASKRVALLKEPLSVCAFYEPEAKPSALSAFLAGAPSVGSVLLDVVNAHPSSFIEVEVTSGGRNIFADISSDAHYVREIPLFGNGAYEVRVRARSSDAPFGLEG